MQELGARLDALHGDLAGDRERIESLGSAVESARAELTGAAEAARELAAGARAQADTAAAEARAHADEQIAALRRDVAAARTAAESRSGELLDELTSARTAAESAEKSVIALRAELETFQAQAEAIRADNAAAREAAAKAAKEVAAGDQRIEAMQSEVAYAVSQIEELKAGLTSAGQAAVIARREAEQAKAAAAQAGEGSTENVTAVFREILGMAARGGAGSGARALSPRPVHAQPERRGARAAPRFRRCVPAVGYPRPRRQVQGAEPVVCAARRLPGARVREGRLAVPARPPGVQAAAGGVPSAGEW